MEPASEYGYGSAGQGWAHQYLLEHVLMEVRKSRASRAFEIGAGNGYVASRIAELGIDVCGIEPSPSGVAFARSHSPPVNIQAGSAYDDLVRQYGKFPLVLSLEVVEHLMYPRTFAKAVHGLLEPDGTALVSTPYHGYLKNLALAVSGKLDDHFTALWDGGHIKFWSIRTLSTLFVEAGLRVERVIRIGRIPPLAKSMLLVLKHENLP